MHRGDRLRLGLPDDALELTWRSLAEIGNLSSASVLHVLARHHRQAAAKRHPGRDDGDGARLLLRTGAAALALTDMCWYVLLIAAVALERIAELVVVPTQPGLEQERAAATSSARATTRRWSSCTPACWSDAWWRRSSCTGRSFPRSAGRCSRSCLPRRVCGGGASATLGHQWNTRVVVVTGASRVDRRAVPVRAAPQLRRGGCSRASRCRWCTPRGSRR